MTVALVTHPGVNLLAIRGLEELESAYSELEHDLNSLRAH